MTEFIDAFVVSWPGKHDNAEHIARQIDGAVDRLTILYANKDDAPGDRPAPWVQFPDAWYFGAQFRAMIDRFDGDVLLHVMADASCEDWSGLVLRLRQTLRDHPDAGVWSPNVDYSSHAPEEIAVEGLPRSSLCLATRTDETVWALTRDVVHRLRALDYDLTPLGWGIDIAAAFYSHAAGKPVLFDVGLPVAHPRSTGYSPADADVQMVRFLDQLSWREKLYRPLLSRPLRRWAWMRRLYFRAARAVAQAAGPPPQAQARLRAVAACIGAALMV